MQATVHITIKLTADSMEDGRTYVTSPDLRGFHFVLNQDEDPMEALIPPLKEFIPLYVKAQLVEILPAYSPHEYRVLRSPARVDRGVPSSLVAAVA